MKTLKSIFALIISVPLLYMPIELALEKASSKGEGTVSLASFDTNEFLSNEWMTSDLVIENENGVILDKLFTYSQVDSLSPEGWKLPTRSELESLLREMGFEGTPGIVPAKYYQFNWEYNGYIDPILGKASAGEKMFLWIKDDGEYNYAVIEKDSLSYRLGRTLKNSQLSARLIRD